MNSKSSIIQKSFLPALLHRCTLSLIHISLASSCLRVSPLVYRNGTYSICCSLHPVSYTHLDRYITDRNFPDKAIDALDEAGSRVHLTNITVPKEIEEQEKLIEERCV